MKEVLASIGILGCILLGMYAHQQAEQLQVYRLSIIEQRKSVDVLKQQIQEVDSARLKDISVLQKQADQYRSDRDQTIEELERLQFIARNSRIESPDSLIKAEISRGNAETVFQLENGMNSVRLKNGITLTSPAPIPEGTLSSADGMRTIPEEF